MDERRHVEAAIAALESRAGDLDQTTIEVAVGILRGHMSRFSDQRREQRKLVTVLFGDVSGFTSLVESIDPEDVTSAINALWRRVDTTIAEYGGTVDKHIGDAVMALFGAPTAREDDAERAVRAALAIQKTLETVTTDAGWAKTELRMRIGLHTGPVHLAIVGTTGEYTAMGDTVNLASRLQSRAQEGGVLISHETWRLVRDVFEADPREPIEVKGKSRPVRSFEVRSERPPGWREAAYELGGIETPLVGREGTLRRLESCLDEVIDTGRGQPLLVSGERGLGKSRVFDTFLRRVLESDRSVLMLRARAGRDGEKVPYCLLRDLVASRFKVLDSDSEAVALAKLEMGVRDLMFERSEETAHLIGHLIGLDLGHSEHIAGASHDPRLLRDRAITAVVRLIESLASRGPVLLSMENLHQADDGSRHLLRRLCSTAKDLPMVVLMSASKILVETDPSFVEESGAMEIEIQPLSDPEAEELARSLLSRAGPPADRVVRRIVQAAGGHPYYLEELARMFLEREAIEGGSEPAGRELETFVPPTLTALLQARLDALHDAARSLLQRAAVIGRTFWDASLKAVDGEDRDGQDRESAIRELISRELINESPQSSFDGLRQYVFRTSLLQEVTYETVLLRERTVFHERVARWLCEQAGDAAPIWAARIASHWEGAENSKAASAWFLKAGEHARKTSAFAEAAESYSKALEHMKDDPGAGPFRIAVYDGLSEVLHIQGRHDGAETAAKAMLAAASIEEDLGGQARAWWKISRLNQTVSKLDEALDAAERSAELARSGRAIPTLARAVIEQGLCLLRLGRLNEAATVLDEALDIGTREGLKLDQALALRLQGAVQARLGRFGPAERQAERALKLLREVGDTVRATACLLSLGELARVRGDLRRAAGRYEEALELARRLGVLGHELVGLSNLGGVLVALGEIEAGEALLRDVLDRAPAGWYGLPETWRFLAEARLAAGHVTDAVETGTRALSLCLESGNSELIGAAWRVLGQAAGVSGRPVVLDLGERDARACFEESRRVLAEANLNPEEARTLREWARHEITRGDAVFGKKLWSQAREWFGMLGMDIEVANTPECAPAA